MSERQFLPQNLQIRSKEDILPFYDQLLEASIESATGFQSFLKNVSELDSAVSENLAWRYIRMTCDTQNKEHETDYLTFVQEIQPHIAPYEDKLNQKIVSSPYIAALESDPAYHIYFRSLKGAVELFRESNIPLQAEVQTLAQEYSAIQGAMSIVYQDKEYTMQQAGNFLQRTDRAEREAVWKLMTERRNQDSEKLESLFDTMVKLRHQMAINAGFDNYRDYMFVALGRFDYTKEDCFAFHQSIKKYIVPIVKHFNETQAKRLNKSKLNSFIISTI
jgi:oligoendopeptidase F